MIADGQGAPTSQIIGHGVGPLLSWQMTINAGLSARSRHDYQGSRKVRYLDSEELQLERPQHDALLVIGGSGFIWKAPRPRR